MNYARLLLNFGTIPILLLWLARPKLLRRHIGSLGVIVALILAASIPWEMVAIDHIWYYSPDILLGPRFLNLPVEELAFYVIDGLLVGSLALVLKGRSRS
ncbi:MAG: lycopene cyclase domain-containing protein [Chloroflexi bacterium]|nr:lycopene cyclase domain-containing protein [Chloroflexota bacterium]